MSDPIAWRQGSPLNHRDRYRTEAVWRWFRMPETPIHPHRASMDGYTATRPGNHLAFRVNADDKSRCHAVGEVTNSYERSELFG